MSGALRVVVVQSGRTIAPFERSVDACGLGAGTFASARAQTLAALGISDVTTAAPDAEVTGPALVISDDVWVTTRALRGFVRAARQRAQSVRLALPPSRLLELTLPLQDVDTDAGFAAFDVAHVPAGQQLRARALFELPRAQWVCPPYKEIALDVPVPRHILRALVGPDARTLQLPLTSTVAMRVRHWVHVLRAGHFAPQVALLDWVSAHPVQAALRAARAVRVTRPALLRALRARFVVRGRRTFIHPTATVEASVLGDDVHIGAYAYVTGSVLGDGCVVEQRAHVTGSSLGPRTFVSLNSSLSACVAFGDTDACINGVQACVFAERGAFTSFARPLDLAPQGQVRVLDGDTLRPAGLLPCGVAFGTDVFVGADVNIAAGRAIPAGVRLFADPARLLSAVDADLAPGDYAVVDGRPRAAPRSAQPAGETPIGSKR